MPHDRLTRALAVLWASCLAIFIGGLGIETVFHLHLPAVLFVGPAVGASVPFFLVVTPGFSGPPYIASAALFTVAVLALGVTLHSLASGEPAFGNYLLATGLAIVLAAFSAWVGRSLWRGLRARP